MTRRSVALPLGFPLSLADPLRHALARGFALGLCGQSGRELWIRIRECDERESVGFVELGERDSKTPRGLLARQMTMLRESHHESQWGSHTTLSNSAGKAEREAPRRARACDGATSRSLTLLGLLRRPRSCQNRRRKIVGTRFLLACDSKSL